MPVNASSIFAEAHEQRKDLDWHEGEPEQWAEVVERGQNIFKDDPND
jgi:hypothetical protein